MSGGFGAVYLAVLLLALSIGFSVPMRTRPSGTHPSTEAVRTQERSS